MSYHRNSSAAISKIDFATRQQAIIDLASDGIPRTDREIYEVLDLFEKGSASPSITNLISAGVLYEVDDVICPKTGKSARRTSLSPRPWKPLREVVIQARVQAAMVPLSPLQLRQLAIEFGAALAKLEPLHHVRVTIRDVDGHRKTAPVVIYARKAPPSFFEWAKP
jgi:hypothetical protein